MPSCSRDDGVRTTTDRLSKPRAPYVTDNLRVLRASIASRRLPCSYQTPEKRPYSRSGEGIICCCSFTGLLFSRSPYILLEAEGGRLKGRVLYLGLAGARKFALGTRGWLRYAASCIKTDERDKAWEGQGADTDKYEARQTRALRST